MNSLELITCFFSLFEPYITVFFLDQEKRIKARLNSTVVLFSLKLDEEEALVIQVHLK